MAIEREAGISRERRCRGLQAKVLMCAVLLGVAIEVPQVHAGLGTCSTDPLPFTGLFPAIESRLSLTHFEPGQVVEIDPRTMSESAAREHIAELQKLGARVSIYLVGGHCDLGADCDSLGPEVRLGATGSWNWDKSERRVLDINHPKVMKRLADGIIGGWKLGANYIRIDNLHFPAGSSEPRTVKQMEQIIDMGQEIEDLLRADGVIEPERPTGLVAHNNLLVWEELVAKRRIRRPPVLLTSERTGQLAPADGYEGDGRMKAGRLSPADVPEIAAGGRLARRLNVPYVIAEFGITHDLANPGRTYVTPQSYIDALAKQPGVTEVNVIPDESQYVGRGRIYKGSGPTTLAASSACAAPRK